MQFLCPFFQDQKIGKWCNILRRAEKKGRLFCSQGKDSEIGRVGIVLTGMQQYLIVLRLSGRVSSLIPKVRPDGSLLLGSGFCLCIGFMGGEKMTVATEAELFFSRSTAL